MLLQNIIIETLLIIKYPHNCNKCPSTVRHGQQEHFKVMTPWQTNS